MIGCGRVRCARWRGRRRARLEPLAAPAVEVHAGAVTVARGGATLVGCRRRGALALCGTATAGWRRGRGEPLAVVGAATTPFAAAGARLAWDHDLTARIGLHAHLGAQVLATTNRFLVDDMAVWSTRRVEGRLGIAVVARLP